MPTAFGPSVRTRVLVREVMNSPVITSEPSETIKDVSQKMDAAGAGSVVVLENDSPIGIVTETDIVRKVACKDLRPSEVRAFDVMSSPLHTIESENEIIEAARRMRKYRVKRLGVSYKNKLVGVISVTDIIAITPELLDIVSEKALALTTGATVHRAYLAGYCDGCNQWSDNLLEIDSKFVCDECTSGKDEDDEVAQENSD